MKLTLTKTKLSIAIVLCLSAICVSFGGVQLTVYDCFQSGGADIAKSISVVVNPISECQEYGVPFLFEHRTVKKTNVISVSVSDSSCRGRALTISRIVLHYDDGDRHTFDGSWEGHLTAFSYANVIGKADADKRTVVDLARHKSRYGSMNIILDSEITGARFIVN